MSKGLFYNPYKVENMNKDIKKISKLDIDGFEFLLGSAEQVMKFKFNKDLLKILRDLKHNSIHAPFFAKDKHLVFSNNNPTKKLMSKIYYIYDKINADNINIHPQQIKDYNVFNSKDFQHSIENMEQKHNLKIDDYKRILKQNPRFKMVLDTTHANEDGTLNKLFKIFKKQIVYTHLSANYYNHLHLPLHTLRPEFLRPLEIIKKGKFPIVLESQIGTDNIKAYQREISFVRNWLKQ
jgi:hypothetical protein